MRRGLAHPRQLGHALGRQVAHRVPRRLAQHPPALRVGLAVIAVRQRALQRQPVGRPGHAKHRRGLGFGQAGHQPQQQRGARAAADSGQQAETAAPGRRHRLLAQLRGGQQQGPELARPVGERDPCRGQAKGPHGGDQGAVAGRGVADLQLGEYRAAAFDATQESRQGGRRRSGFVGGARHRGLGVIAPHDSRHAGALAP